MNSLFLARGDSGNQRCNCNCNCNCVLCSQHLHSWLSFSLLECVCLFLRFLEESSVEADGFVERRNAEILKHLRILVQNRDILDEWSLVLPLVQRILNFTKDGSINMAPAQILFGDMIPYDLSLIMTSNEESGTIQIVEFLEKLKQKLLLLIQATQKYLTENASKREERGNLIIDVPVFDVGDYVLLTYRSRPPSKLAGLYRGPMVLNRRLRQDLCRLALRNMIYWNQIKL